MTKTRGYQYIQKTSNSKLREILLKGISLLAYTHIPKKTPSTPPKQNNYHIKATNTRLHIHYIYIHKGAIHYTPLYEIQYT